MGSPATPEDLYVFMSVICSFIPEIFIENVQYPTLTRETEQIKTYFSLGKGEF